MIVAIHQPNFLPWLGYFLKMSCADAFIYLDNVPFSKHGYLNRVRIKGREDARWLSVPVLAKGRSGQLIDEVEINNATRWREQHLNTLRTEYGAAPCFRGIFAALQDTYQDADGNLARFNLRLLERLTDWLALRPRFFLASQIGVEGTGSQLLLRLVQAVGGDIYLSGPSGREYLDLDLFARSGVLVRFHSLRHPVYAQFQGPFCEGLSTIDLLMNAGEERARVVLANAGSRTDSAGEIQPEV